MRSIPFFAFALIGLALCGCGRGPGAGPTDAQLSSARKAAPAGAKVFALHCSSCHGEHGDAPMAPPAMGKHALRRRPGLENGLDLFDYLKSRMPPADKAGSLSERQYWDVTEYLLRVQGRDVPTPFERANAAGVMLE